ncbi:unnamed protein product [Brugia timori]|uniref:Uncharacterized protein n=1 Tax=Brugia timori TaxID=42155 RepID=A0A3P7VL17_9BILA|nr:unnamed protein product [Brugia timori]
MSFSEGFFKITIICIYRAYLNRISGQTTIVMSWLIPSYSNNSTFSLITSIHGICFQISYRSWNYKIIYE